MKAKIIITPKKAVLDPQGKTVQGALAHLGVSQAVDVRIGKYVEIDIAAGSDLEATRAALDDACRRFLSNPVIEDYRLEIA
jgi:phosphoribosylformylglycinamidine synthase subunit PurS